MGHIFLNTSLTEAYCMAIVEAASCGLQVVSTRVGGIPEVLPESLIILTEPTIDSVLDGLHLAIERERNRRRPRSCSNKKVNRNSKNIATDESTNSNEVVGDVLCPFECNEIVRGLYNWQNIARRTERVYRRVLGESNIEFGRQLENIGSACVPFMLVFSYLWLWLAVLEWLVPKRNIDVARDFQKSPKANSEEQLNEKFQTKC